jgi:hypothetical protein
MKTNLFPKNRKDYKKKEFHLGILSTDIYKGHLINGKEKN